MVKRKSELEPLVSDSEDSSVCSSTSTTTLLLKGLSEEELVEVQFSDDGGVGVVKRRVHGREGSAQRRLPPPAQFDELMHQVQQVTRGLAHLQSRMDGTDPVDAAGMGRFLHRPPPLRPPPPLPPPPPPRRRRHRRRRRKQRLWPTQPQMQPPPPNYPPPSVARYLRKLEREQQHMKQALRDITRFVSNDDDDDDDDSGGDGCSSSATCVGNGQLLSSPRRRPPTSPTFRRRPPTSSHSQRLRLPAATLPPRGNAYRPATSAVAQRRRHSRRQERYSLKSCERQQNGCYFPPPNRHYAPSDVMRE